MIHSRLKQKIKQMKKFFLAILIVLSNQLQAQTIKRCGTMEHQLELERQNPSILKSRESIERYTQQFIQQGNANRSNVVVITIPVVFHIIYSTAAQNISTARINAQIERLNIDFAKMNSDTGLIPPAFQSIAANTQIQFCLAQQDPNGVSTNGILRISTTTNPLPTFPSSVSAPWNRNNYLNIYVGNFSGGILGVAQLPGGSASSDYVNALFTTVGGPGALGTEPNYDLGRTLTHEIGHWLNLYHTFEGGCSGLTANNCANAGDRVCDTPPTSSSNFGCPGIQNTCTETTPFPPPYSNDQNDQTMNYMDYPDDACMFMFSAGQAARMTACLNGIRSSLLTSPGCSPVIISVDDAGVTAINSPTGFICAANYIPEVTIKNYGTAPLTSVDINYQIDNGAVQTQTYSGSLANNASATVTFPVQNATAGTHLFKCFTTLPNGFADPNPINDTAVSSYNIVAGQAIPYQQPFTSAVPFPPTGWTISNPDGGVTWERNGSYGHLANGSIWMDNANYSSNSEIDEAIMPPLDLTTTAGASLNFWVAYTYWTLPYQYSDTLEILISTDCGVTFTTIYKKWGPALATAPGQASDFFPTASQWRLENVSLAPYLTSNKAIIKFRNITDYENNLFIDDINIDLTTGINSTNIQSTFNVHPNPTTGIVYIKYDNKEQQLVDLKVLNSLGEVLLTETLKVDGSINKRLDLSGYANGVYQIVLTNSEQTLYRKFVIAK